MVLVDGADAQPGNEAFPDAELAAGLKRCPAGVPAVEIADHRDGLELLVPKRRGRPLAIAGDDPVGAELLIEAQGRSPSSKR